MPAIPDLVAALPECYQPVFGHEELSRYTSRACHDRLALLERVTLAMRECLGRPPRLLDLGCAQGFMTLSLARHCERVVGVDMRDANVALCRALAREADLGHASFKQGTIQSAIAEVKDGEFDLVLGLSVFHHIGHADGADRARQLLTELSARSNAALLLEFAVREEGVYWAKSLPEHPEDWLADIPFHDRLAIHSTRLSAVPRPLYFASDAYWFCDGVVERFRSWQARPRSPTDDHRRARPRRIYYFSDRHFLKWYDGRGDADGAMDNFKDYERELTAIRHRLPDDYKADYVPALLGANRGDDRAWVLYARIAGETAAERMQRGAPVDIPGILAGTLDALCRLESAGLYHDDIRTWNIFLREPDDTVVPIDFAAIDRIPRDCAWPQNVFLSFLVFANELGNRHRDFRMALRAPWMAPTWSNDPVAARFLSVLWSTPHTRWSFAFFRETLRAARGAPADGPQPVVDAANMTLWMRAMEVWHTQVIDVQMATRWRNAYKHLAGTPVIRQLLWLRRRLRGVADPVDE